MPNLNLHKFDYKGNVVKEWYTLVAGGPNQYPCGIATDKNDLWFVQQDTTGSTYLRRYNKKGIAIKSYTLGSVYRAGIATNRGRFSLSDNGGGVNLTSLDKKNAQIQTTSSVARIAMSFDGGSLTGAKTSSAQLDVVDQKSAAVKRTASLATSPVGINSLSSYYALVSLGPELVYASRSGALVKVISLPNPKTNGYRDLCHDNSNFWMLSYAAVGIG